MTIRTILLAAALSLAGCYEAHSSPPLELEPDGGAEPKVWDSGWCIEEADLFPGMTVLGPTWCASYRRGESPGPGK